MNATTRHMIVIEVPTVCVSDNFATYGDMRTEEFELVADVYVSGGCKGDRWTPPEPPCVEFDGFKCDESPVVFDELDIALLMAWSDVVVCGTDPDAAALEHRHALDEQRECALQALADEENDRW